MSNLGLTLDKLRVSLAVVKTPEYRPEDDLFDLLDFLRDRYAVLIVDGDKRLTGIITEYDTTEYFRSRAEDLMIVEDIELTLRDPIQASFTDGMGVADQNALTRAIAELSRSAESRKQFRAALEHYAQMRHQGPVDAGLVEEIYTKYFVPPKVASKSFEDLTLYEYGQLLTRKSGWSYFQDIFHVERDAVLRLLNSVRNTRNVLAHFRGELSSAQRDQLRYCKNLLTSHLPLAKAVPPLPTAVAVEWSARSPGCQPAMANRALRRWQRAARSTRR